MHETRQLLKILGVAVTDFEGEAEKLKSAAEQLTDDPDNVEIASYMRNVAEQRRKLNTRWLEVTQRVFQSQTNCWLVAPRLLIGSHDGSN